MTMIIACQQQQLFNLNKLTISLMNKFKWIIIATNLITKFALNDIAQFKITIMSCQMTNWINKRLKLNLKANDKIKTTKEWQIKRQSHKSNKFSNNSANKTTSFNQIQHHDKIISCQTKLITTNHCDNKTTKLKQD